MRSYSFIALIGLFLTYPIVSFQLFELHTLELSQTSTLKPSLLNPSHYNFKSRVQKGGEKQRLANRGSGRRELANRGSGRREDTGNGRNFVPVV
jgi:hypothetical protein